MKPTKIDHIGVAVRSIDETLAVYRAIGIQESAATRETVAGQQVRVAFLPVGESRIELLEPSSEGSPIAKFLAKRGPGIHHVCFAVDDLDGALAELDAKGVRLIHRTPVPGAGGKRVAFLHPESGDGVLIELAERKKS
jgi:methylmalonyl-CoA/ethylmalonyl-CoA epimerase